MVSWWFSVCYCSVGKTLYSCSQNKRFEKCVCHFRLITCSNLDHSRTITIYILTTDFSKCSVNSNIFAVILFSRIT